MSFDIDLNNTRITSIGYNSNVDPYKLLFKVIFDNLNDFSVTLMTKPNLTDVDKKDIRKEMFSLQLKSTAEKSNTALNIVNNSVFKSVNKIAIITILTMEELEDKFFKWCEVEYNNLSLTAGIFSALKDKILILNTKTNLTSLAYNEDVDLIIIDNIASIISDKTKFQQQYSVAKEIISINVSKKTKFVVMQTYNKNIMSTFRVSQKPNLNDLDNDDIWRNSSLKYHFFFPSKVDLTFYNHQPTKIYRKGVWYSLAVFYNEDTDTEVMKYLK